MRTPSREDLEQWIDMQGADESRYAFSRYTEFIDAVTIDEWDFDVDNARRQVRQEG